MILSPVSVVDSGNEKGFVWPNLRVRTSGQAENAGLGVFASAYTAAGTKIPVKGVPLTSEDVAKLEGCLQATHIMCQSGRGGYIAVDGRPGNAPFHGVGGGVACTSP